jgi:transposase
MKRITAELEAEIVRLHAAERWPIGTIARQLEIHHSVVRRVLGRKELVGPSLSERPSIVDPYLPFIREQLARYPTLSASRLLVMLKDRGYPGQKSRLREVVARLRPRPKAEAYLRLRTLPGEQAQVDWADFGTLKIGRAERPLMAFVVVLSWSRRLVARFYLGAQMPVFLAGHVYALGRLGGAPRELLYDNLKSAVVERRGDAIRFNATLLDLATHYRFAPKACAPRRGNEKGRVERAIRYIREAFFAARAFDDLDDLNAQLEAFCDGPAMDRRWPEDQTRTVRDAFAEEQPRLLSLPDEPFPCEAHVPVQVGKTPYVRFDLNDYSVPHGHVESERIAVTSVDRVRIVDGATVVADHPRSYDRGARVEDPRHESALIEHKAAAKQHRGTDRLVVAAPSSRAFLIRVAERGHNLGTAVAQLLRLLDEYGACPLEQAVAECIQRDVIHIPAVRQLLQQDRHAALRLPGAQPQDPRLRDIVVRPHALTDYDQLTHPDKDYDEDDLR